MKNAGDWTMYGGIALTVAAARGWELDPDLPAGDPALGWAAAGVAVIYLGYRVSVWLDARKAR